MRLTLDEYSKEFKMSKEMINSKLRAKKLNYIIEGGITYIIVARDSINKNRVENIAEKKEAAPITENSVVHNLPAKPKTTVATVLALYQRENKHLKDKITQLEAKVDKLVNDKEQMLRDEISKLEQIYTAKDEQLKNILELINTKLMLEQQPQTIHEIESFDKEQKAKENFNDSQLVELKEYLRTLDLVSHQRKAIKKRFLAVYDNDIRIIQQNGKLYLDFSRYDYSDLLSL